MREIDGLPVYKITIDKDYADDGEDLGIDMIAFTKKPAIKTKGLAFSSQAKVQFFADDSKMRIAAPAMIPMDIYRFDEETEEEYYVQFTEEVIEQLYSKFMQNLSSENVFNLEHNAQEKVPAYVLESFIVDSDAKQKMVKSEYNVDVPKGSVFVVSQITDKDYYNQLVKDEQVGYSIEGMLGLKLSELKSQNKMENPKFELDGKFYELKDGVPVEVAMATEEETEEVVEAAEEKKEDEVEMAEPKEEEKEEELMEPEEEKEVEAEVDPAVDADAIMAIVAPALEALRSEILEALAEKQVEEEEVEEEVEMEEVKMSITEKFGAVMRGYKNLDY